MPEYSLTQKAEAQAKVFGLSKREVFGMARRSARVTHPKGNRRYHDYVLAVDKHYQITDVAKFAVVVVGKGCRECDHKGFVVVFETCPMCDGGTGGCKYCNHEGGKRKEIPCQYCR